MASMRGAKLQLGDFCHQVGRNVRLQLSSAFWSLMPRAIASKASLICLSVPFVFAEAFVWGKFSVRLAPADPFGPACDLRKQLWT